MAISMSASKFGTYRLCRALIVLAALAPVSALGADVLPLERGRYFDVGVACESPGKATVFVYDGTGFSHEKTNCSLDRLRLPPSFLECVSDRRQRILEHVASARQARVHAASRK
ncbi:hypothetical protein [Ensifer sp. M14]|uniref:hypothetical protein n=1 Tax=Ensifer sp. M14 TaxID=2203782 RepID=UPI0011C0813A|nr:hypothetical protein [Ensifer sp. M14]